MFSTDYKVIKIESEYATLLDLNSASELFIAIALLPVNTDIDTVLHYENFEYSIIS